MRRSGRRLAASVWGRRCGSRCGGWRVSARAAAAAAAVVADVELDVGHEIRLVLVDVAPLAVAKCANCRVGAEVVRGCVREAVEVVRGHTVVVLVRRQVVRCVVV